MPARSTHMLRLATEPTSRMDSRMVCRAWRFAIMSRRNCTPTSPCRHDAARRALQPALAAVCAAAAPSSSGLWVRWTPCHMHRVAFSYSIAPPHCRSQPSFPGVPPPHMAPPNPFSSQVCPSLCTFHQHSPLPLIDDCTAHPSARPAHAREHEPRLPPSAPHTRCVGGPTRS